MAFKRLLIPPTFEGRFFEQPIQTAERGKQALGRRQSREVAFKTLFQKEQGGVDPEKALQFCLLENPLSEKDKLFAEQLIKGTLSHLDNIDSIISRHLIKWDLKRLAAVDRAVLRLALYELIYLPEIPAAVTINEAVELTKKFQDEDSANFINGILDRIRKDLYLSSNLKDRPIP